MIDLKIKKNTKELEAFIKKANRKLVELEVFQSVSDLKNGKSKTYKSAREFMRYINSKVS